MIREYSVSPVAAAFINDCSDKEQINTLMDKAAEFIKAKTIPAFKTEKEKRVAIAIMGMMQFRDVHVDGQRLATIWKLVNNE